MCLPCPPTHRAQQITVQPTAPPAHLAHSLDLRGNLHLASDVPANLIGLASDAMWQGTALLALAMILVAAWHGLNRANRAVVRRFAARVDTVAAPDGRRGDLAQPQLPGHAGGMSKNSKNPKRVAAGRAGGQVKSEAKAQAARANGAAGGGKGGRPKGMPITTEHAQKAAAARAAQLSPERRREIALKAVAAREAKRKNSAP